MSLQDTGSCAWLEPAAGAALQAPRPSLQGMWSGVCSSFRGRCSGHAAQHEFAVHSNKFVCKMLSAVPAHWQASHALGLVSSAFNSSAAEYYTSCRGESVVVMHSVDML